MAVMRWINPLAGKGAKNGNRRKPSSQNLLNKGLADLEAKKTRTDFKVLNEYLVNKGVAPEEALGKLKEFYGE